MPALLRHSAGRPRAPTYPPPVELVELGADSRAEPAGPAVDNPGDNLWTACGRPPPPYAWVYRLSEGQPRLSFRQPDPPLTSSSMGAFYRAQTIALLARELKV